MSVHCVQGYQGLVDGGDHIRPATWESVSMMLQLVSLYCQMLEFITFSYRVFNSILMQNNSFATRKNMLKLIKDDTVVGH